MARTEEKVSGRAPWRSPGVLAGVALAAAGLFWLAQGRVLRGVIAVVVSLAVVAFFRSRSRRYATFALITVLLATLVPLGAIVALDLYLHGRYGETGGYNVWGYRGPIAGARAAGERRVAVLGGSAAFGYGVKTHEAFPAYLEQQLDGSERSAGRGPVRVINLAWNGEGAYAFRPTLEDYDYLAPDAVILYSGYNDLAPNTQVFRHQSAIFRATGYMPILPVLPIDRWLRIRDLSETQHEGRVVFQPNLADRSAASVADVALQVTKALERQLERIADEGDPADTPRTGTNCGRWERYCHALSDAIRAGLARGRHVIVVTEPYVAGGGRASSLHVNQQSTIAAMLAAQFPGEPRLHYINMGRAVDLTDTALCYDGLHLTAEGNRRLAAQLAPAVAEILATLDRTTPADPVRLLPTSAADAAAARGQLREARVLTAAAVRTAIERGDRPEASRRLARLALAEWVLGNVDAGVTTVTSALEQHRNADTLWAAALLQAMDGDAALARSLADEFVRVAPRAPSVNRLWAPVLTGAIRQRAGDQEGALQALERAVIHDRESYWPRYLRGVLHLQRGHGHAAEEEFLRIVAQPELDPADPVLAASKARLAQARVQQGNAAQYGETYQAVFSAWKHADAGLPLFEQTKAEYLELRKSIGLPPLPY